MHPLSIHRVLLESCSLSVILWLCDYLNYSIALNGWVTDERRIEKDLDESGYGLFQSIVGPANQGGCIIRCVGNLADEKL
jgi:hypothetical protein